MNGRGFRGIQLRTALIGVAVLALIFASLHEIAIHIETRKFIDFHDGRARHLLGRATRFGASRPDITEEYRRLATWHVDRANEYRRARKLSFSDEMKQDLRQTMLEQSFEQSLPVGGPGGDPPSSLETGS